MVGALVGSVGTSDAQNYRYYNNAYGPGPAYQHSPNHCWFSSCPKTLIMLVDAEMGDEPWTLN
jgi:hypothetical protein